MFGCDCDFLTNTEITCILQSGQYTLFFLKLLSNYFFMCRCKFYLSAKSTGFRLGKWLSQYSFVWTFSAELLEFFFYFGKRCNFSVFFCLNFAWPIIANCWNFRLNYAFLLKVIVKKSRWTKICMHKRKLMLCSINTNNTKLYNHSNLPSTWLNF